MLWPRRPAFQWAMLHNWLYFLSLGLSVPNLPRVVSSIVNPDGSVGVTPASIKLSGDVEAVDKVLTFLGVGFLCALSDVKGRKALMAWSALGYGLTCLLQGTTKSSVGLLYLADLIDGVSSCMSPVCQAYVTDASPPDRRVINLGIFQGISIGGAFIVAFPLGGVLGSKLGPRVPILLGAAAQLLNFMLIAFVTPESNTKEMRQGKRINLKEANPFVRRPCGINKTPADSRPAPSLLLLTRLRVVRRCRARSRSSSAARRCYAPRRSPTSSSHSRAACSTRSSPTMRSTASAGGRRSRDRSWCPPHHPARRTTLPTAPPCPPHHPAPLAARPLAPLPPCALPLRGP